tara:strand:+ start:4638 stop:4796 length:159 start_codon:yes stop_codon:yes gene_type:complete
MSLKKIPADNKGLPQLPKQVRNKMGYMKKGGAVVSNGQGKVMKDRIKTTKMR